MCITLHTQNKRSREEEEERGVFSSADESN